ANTTSAARATPATPLDVSISVTIIVACCPIVRWIPAACATNTDVSDRYSVEPSKLKLYPSGNTNATIGRGTPSSSIVSIARGHPASLDAVKNAISAASLTPRPNRLNGTRINSATGTSTSPKNTTSAPYSVPTSAANLNNTPSPPCPTVYAIAAPTPI